MKILPQSAFSKSPKEQMLCAFGENNPHRAFYLSRHRCMMLKNFLSFLKPKAGFSSCKKQIGLSFIDVFLKCQERERSRIEWQWHQYYIEVVTLSVGHTRNSVPLAIRNPPHVTASHHRGLKFQSSAIQGSHIALYVILTIFASNRVILSMSWEPWKLSSSKYVINHQKYYHF